MRQQKYEAALREALRITEIAAALCDRYLDGVDRNSAEGVVAAIDCGKVALLAIRRVEKLAEEALRRD